MKGHLIIDGRGDDGSAVDVLSGLVLTVDAHVLGDTGQTRGGSAQ